MGFEFIKKLPTPAEIKQQYPVPEKVAQIKKERDAIESGGTARHRYADASVVDKKRGRSSAPFSRNATAGQHEKDTQGQCVRY